MLLVRSRLEESGTATRSLLPSNVRELLNLPWVFQAGPLIVPEFPEPERSVA